MCLTLALELFGFTSHAQGSDRSAFLTYSQKKFCHIFLGHVNNPARGRYNKISFISAELNDIDELPMEYWEDIRSRICERFPAVCIGYTIINPSNPSAKEVTTITYPFTWPTSSVKGVGLQKAICLIYVVEWILQMENRVRNAKRKAGA